MDAQQLHRDALVWDAHRDVAFEKPLMERFLQRSIMGVDLHLPLLEKGGINVQTFAFCIGPEVQNYTAQAIKEFEQVFAILEEESDRIVLVTKTAEALQAKQEGKIAAFLNFEGAEPIMTELELLRIFYRLGLRAMGLTWNNRNELADGGYEEGTGGGLSNFGRSVVQEMNRLGMVIDMAHLASRGMLDVLRISEQPVIHSHGGVRAINPTHPRALEDSMLEGIARKDGVFCATTVPTSLGPTQQDATLERFLDIIDHCVSVMGADHVGLGADFDVYQSHLPYALGAWTKDLEEADKWPNITEGLVARGYSEADIRKILGENLLRVYREIIG